MFLKKVTLKLLLCLVILKNHNRIVFSFLNKIIKSKVKSKNNKDSKILSQNLLEYSNKFKIFMLKMLGFLVELIRDISTAIETYYTHCDRILASMFQLSAKQWMSRSCS